MGLLPHPRAADPDERWFSVGRSLDPDPRHAGATAASQAQQGRRASLLLVFCSSLLDATEVLAGVCSQTSGTTVVAGGTTMGELAPSGPGLEDLGLAPGVVVTALGGPGFEVASVVALEASTDRRGAGAAVAAALAGISHPQRALIMIADGLTREHHEIVRGAYAEVGASVPIVGGCTADQVEYVLTHQFHGTGDGVQVLTDAVVGIGLGTTGAVGAGIAHGWSKTGEAMTVSASVSGKILQLDGEPAAPAYLSRLPGGRSWEDWCALRDKDPVELRELLFRYPLGLSRRSGEDLRVVHDFDPGQQSIECLADVPQGALAWLMTTDPGALVDAAAESCHSALSALGEAQPLGFLVFDCGARKLKLGPAAVRAEQEAIAGLAGSTPFGGFYTYGEIGRMQGARGMHHVTVVTLALS